MTEQSGNPSSPSGQVVLESPTSSGRSEGKGTNEELQATMIQVLKSMEIISLETKGENPFPINFKMPAFPTFTGEDGSVSSRDHIFKFSNHCVAYEDNPNYKLRLFGNSLAGLASQWYSLLPPNSISNWGQMEMAFHE
ncbi:hypothetical protein ACFX1S_044081 [Malus domestica]